MVLITKGKVERTPSELSSLPSEAGCLHTLASFIWTRRRDGVFPSAASPQARFLKCPRCLNGNLVYYFRMCKLSRWACVTTPVSMGPRPGCPFCFGVGAGAPQRPSQARLPLLWEERCPHSQPEAMGAEDQAATLADLTGRCFHKQLWAKAGRARKNLGLWQTAEQEPRAICALLEVYLRDTEPLCLLSSPAGSLLGHPLIQVAATESPSLSFAPCTPVVDSPRPSAPPASLSSGFSQTPW